MLLSTNTIRLINSKNKLKSSSKNIKENNLSIIRYIDKIKSNFDFIFLLGEDFINNRKKLYEHYAGMFPTRELFDQVFMQVTDNYGCMVINNRLRTTDIRKKVFWYKAEKRNEFKVGS